MNLTGHWKGKYTYGAGYPSEYIGKSAAFEIELLDDNGILTGTCVDELVKMKEGNASYIIGTFREKAINFKKRYKFHFALGDTGLSEPEEGVTSDGVDYKGRLRKKFFSRRLYFSGDWRIVMKYRDDNDLPQTCTCRGTWKMSKAR